MNHSIHINLLHLLHHMQVSTAKLVREGSRHTASAMLRLFHSYRRAFNDNAANTPEIRYHEDVTRRIR